MEKWAHLVAWRIAAALRARVRAPPGERRPARGHRNARDPISRASRALDSNVGRAPVRFSEVDCAPVFCGELGGEGRSGDRRLGSRWVPLRGMKRCRGLPSSHDLEGAGRRSCPRDHHGATLRPSDADGTRASFIQSVALATRLLAVSGGWPCGRAGDGFEKVPSSPPSLTRAARSFHPPRRAVSTAWRSIEAHDRRDRSIAEVTTTRGRRRTGDAHDERPTRRSCVPGGP